MVFLGRRQCRALVQYVHILHPKATLLLEAPSFGRLAGEVAFGIFLYDLLFYPLHWAMHNLPSRALRNAHSFHHRKAHTLNALETVQHSYADGLLQVVVNIAVQQLSPFPGVLGKHPLSRIIHNVVVTYLLTESHSGYRDLPFMSHNLWPSLFAGAPRHERHHHNGRVYYHQFFKYLDDGFGYVEPATAPLSPPRPVANSKAALAAPLAMAVLAPVDVK